MIKKVTLLLFLVLIVTKTNAQFQDPQTYQLAFGISTYQPLSTTDSLLNRIDGKPCINCKGDFWNDDEDNDTSMKVFQFNLYDFDINLYSQTYKTKEFPIAKNYSGYVTFSDYVEPLKTNYSRIVFLFHPLKDRGTKDHSVSPIRKKVEGIKPNRILKVEYRNAGLKTDETNLDSINIQFWYIEADSSVEIHWGKCSVKNQELVFDNEGKDHFFSSFMTRESYPGSTEFDEIIRPGGRVDSLYEVTSNVRPFTFEGVPYDGQYFRFSRKKVSAGIANKQLLAAEVFPNPTTGFVYIRGINHQQTSSVTIYNLVGQLVLSQTLAPLEDVVAIQALNKGLYVMHIEQNNKQYTTRIVKQ